MSSRQTASTSNAAPMPAMKHSRASGDAMSKPLSQSCQPQDIRIQLQYLSNDLIYKTQKPLQITPNFKDVEGRSNVRLAPGEFEIIHDVRGKDTQFSLDQNGFQYVHAPTTFTEWQSQPKIAQQYLPELATLLKKEVEGCDEIVFYDARLRFENEEGIRVQGLSYNPFARQVHTDGTETSIVPKIRNLTDLKADYVLSGRCRIINIWRPIKHPVYDCGLAIADGGKLRKGDVIECDRHRHDTGNYWDTMGVAQYRPGLDWYYMSRQDESDVLLFKGYDSATDVAATTCLHTAFDVPSKLIPVNSPTRESIEVRALIVTYPQHRPRPTGGLNMPHPLAATLEQSDLKPMDFDQSLTDHVRTDIDEGSEVKDAVLLLRKREIRRLENVQKSLQSQRDRIANDLRAAQSQIAIQTQHIHALTTELAETRRRQASVSAAAAGDGIHPDERAIFTQQLARAHMETEKWKLEAAGRGNDAVSRCWQASVDEAIRREREKDAAVIDGLRAEIRDLSLRLV